MFMKTCFIFLLFIFIGLSACEKAETVAAFTENLKINMREVMDSTKRTLLLICNTESMYVCSNYSIQSDYKVTNDKITINFVQIITPSTCLTAPGPASTLIEFEGLANKVYKVELNLGATRISGQLDVSANSFKATLPIQTKVRFINPELGRVPDNTIFGTVRYHTASTAPVVQKFIDSLQFYGAATKTYPPGNYGQFQIEANGQIKQVQDAGYYFTRYYILMLRSD